MKSNGDVSKDKGLGTSGENNMPERQCMFTTGRASNTLKGITMDRGDGMRNRAFARKKGTCQ